MPVLRIALVLALASGCGKSDDPPAAVAPAPPASTEFANHRWVRTTRDGVTPFIGFTYVDGTKQSIKGFTTTGLSPGQIKAKLKEPPNETLSPLPAGHPMTPLSPAEITQLELPPEPIWLRFYR